MPLGCFAAHAPAEVQKSPLGQSLSVAHATQSMAAPHLSPRHSPGIVHGPSPLAKPQLPSKSHAFERQVAAFAAHGPSPLAKPHALSFVSHAPEAHTRAPTAVEHVVTSAGLVGSAAPFGSFGTHDPVPPIAALHHVNALQSASARQAVPQAPVATSQIDPPAWPAQSALAAHLAQTPSLLPVRLQYGVALGQAWLADPPWSPLQATQVSLCVLQSGVLPVHAVVFVAVHWTQAPEAGSHAGVAPWHDVSARHAWHLPAFAPVIAHKVERQTVLPFAPVHGPSPVVYPHLPSTSQTPERHLAGALVQGPSPFE